MKQRVEIAGKRIMAMDYGDARIGVAVCDDLHIVVSPRPIIPNNSQTLEAIKQRIDADRIDLVVIGVPRRHDDTITPIMERCLQFIAAVQEAVDVPVLEVDEAFSTARAREIMLSGGMSKKRRQQKGTKDVVAAAVILRDFIEEHH